MSCITVCVALTIYLPCFFFAVFACATETEAYEESEYSVHTQEYLGEVRDSFSV